MTRGLLLLLCLAAVGCVDRGKCLKGHTHHHHLDAYTTFDCMPALNLYTGQITTECGTHYHWAEDWDEYVCDQWEFPNGRMEKDDPPVKDRRMKK